MKKYNLIFSLFVLLLAVNVISCQDDAESFDSKVITGDVSKKVATHLLKPGVDEMLQTFQATIPQPVESDIHIVYKAEPSLVTTYNEIYYDAAVALPEDYYEVKESNVIINKGSVVSTDVVLHFKDLTALNSNLVYVLPVTVAESDWELLESARTVYYVFKGAALINTVANIKERRLKPNFLHAGVLIGLKTITVEALVRADELNNKISTLMGIEGKFLLRFSDQGLPENQLQLATTSTNATNPNWTIETGKWVHIAFTYDGNTGQSEMFALAFAAMEVIKKHGLRIPDDIAIIGYTDEQHANYVEPKLSAVSHQTYKMGETACRLLIEQIKGDKAVKQVVIPTHLQVRESSIKSNKVLYPL